MLENKILVVDDEIMICHLYTEFFTDSGYVVKTAGSGEEALQILADERYWVMFLDLNLPGMSGVDLCRRIKTDWPMAIHYATTGYASWFELADCRDAGFEDYFIKPVPLTDLLNAARIAFDRLSRWKKIGP
jgi:DNA-binding response OmpR family regulator